MLMDGIRKIASGCILTHFLLDVLHVLEENLWVVLKLVVRSYLSC